MNEALLIVSGILNIGLVIVFVLNRKKKSLDVEPEPEPRVVDYREDKKLGVSSQKRLHYSQRQNVGKTISSTKHKHLQPGNIQSIQEMINKTTHDVKNFEHKFFGTVLMIDGRVIIDSLPRKLHTFEVVDGQCYIDGREVKVHPDEVLKLARTIE